MNVGKFMELLGKKVQDQVTGLKGIVTSVGFDLYGCVQAIVHPGLDKDGKTKDSLWFDVDRLKVLSDKPVMTPPNFQFGPETALKGPADKPREMKH